MQRALATMTGKAVKAGLKFRRHGGHTLPGLIVESLFPGYLRKMVDQLPEGVVLITGTNGKTTTTKIVTDILKASGKKVLTNQTGSNLTRGIVSSITQHATATGKLKQDIAVLEVDEAQARRLVENIKPDWVLALNVSRDQLDRYGEVDTIASYIAAAMSEASRGIITNARDPHLIKAAQTASKGRPVEVEYFGAAEKLTRFFPSDYELAAVEVPVKSREKIPSMAVELKDFDGQNVSYKIDGRVHEAELRLRGQHNFLNAAAALAICAKLLPDVPAESLLESLSKVELAFGRGEKYQLRSGAQIELVLVKNPASFTQALSSYGAKDTNLMIAINDNIADGRDVSWLWDVDFKPLAGQRVAVTSGRRAGDMALRLSYDDINVANIEPSLQKALKLLGEMNGPKVILSTYTAMLQLYKLLSKQGERMP